MPRSALVRRCAAPTPAVKLQLLRRPPPCGLPAREGTHSSQVSLFDRQGRLAFRTVDLPIAAHVADLLQQLATA